MRVDIAKLFEAFRKAAWRWGVTDPSSVKHIVNGDGSHELSLRLTKDDVWWKPESGEVPLTLASTLPPPRERKTSG